MRLLSTVAVGVSAFAVTAASLYVVLFSWLLAWFFAYGSLRTELPFGLRFSIFIAFNVALALLAVLLPLWLIHLGGHKVAISRNTGVFITAVLLALFASWFLRVLSDVNNCSTGIAFPFDRERCDFG